METSCDTFMHNRKTVVIEGWANSISNLIFENWHVDSKIISKEPSDFLIWYYLRISLTFCIQVKYLWKNSPAIFTDSSYL